MANSDIARGLQPLRMVNGSPYNGSTNLYHVAAADGQVIAPGDPVLVTGASDADGIPTVTRATAGVSNYITGVMAGLSNGLNSTVTRDDGLPTTASTSQYIAVIDDPDVSFEVQCNGTLTTAMVSGNADLNAGTASALGISAFELDISTFGVAATQQLRILRLIQRGDNVVGAFAKVEVKLNTHSQTHTLGV